jgi:ABC-type phosphate transport system substrate-binding protein
MRMSKSTTMKLTVTFAVVALALSSACGAAQRPLEDTGTTLVIINAGNQESPSPDALRSVYTGRVRHWSSGGKVEVVDLASNPPQRAAFLRRVLGVSPTEYDRLLLKEAYTSSWTGPRKAVDDQEVLNLVAAHPGAIGFIAPRSLTPELQARVRVVLRL